MVLPDSGKWEVKYYCDEDKEWDKQNPGWDDWGHAKEAWGSDP